MESDRDLELLTARKMAELRRRLAAEKAREKVKEKTDREVLTERLVDRGSEVLETAERTYPKQAAIIVKKLSSLIKDGTLKNYISGGELLALFRALRLNVRVETRIAVEEGGKLVSLQDKFKFEE